MADRKNALLDQVRSAVADGTITKDDLNQLMGGRVSAPTKGHTPEVNRVVNVVEVLFFLAGFVLYGALAVAAGQAGSQSWRGSMLLFIPGLVLWAATRLVTKRSTQTESTKGLTNALLLTGSLAVITGGLLATYQIGNAINITSWAYISAVALVLLGGLHLLFDRLDAHPLLVVIGFYLLIGAFPIAMSGALAGVANHVVDIWALVGMATGVLIGYAGIIVAKTAPGRLYLRGAFLPVGGVVVLGSAYLASQMSTVAVIWEVILPLLIYTSYFFSIKRHSKYFLVTGSIFLALLLITVSFRYFAGLGASFCLLVSGISLLATAYLAITINKRYVRATSA